MKWLKKRLDKLAMWYLKPTIKTEGEIIFTDDRTLIKNIIIESKGMVFKNGLMSTNVTFKNTKEKS